MNLSQTNSVASVYLAALRDISIQKDRFKFRHNLKRLGQLMGYEVSKTLVYKNEDVQTPLGTASVNLLKSQPVVIAVMRAALPFFEGVLSVFDEADSGFVGAYRASDFQSSKSINTDYIASGKLTGKTVLLVDPMLATGNSLLEAIAKLKDHGKPDKWIVLSVIAAPEGVKNLEENLPEGSTLWCGAIDKGLNEKSYIVPGLGDAGDLAYGEKI
ncbi:MAG: uracil phosphoribosyltransferase [Cyclobacteriaceae bacterium]|nr:uracil phosphoribosyltransferase [Cyclobacteriaceae bacterium]